MKKTMIALMLLWAVVLGGCAKIYDGSYSTVKPHEQSFVPAVSQTLSADDRQELYGVLTDLIESGREEAVIFVDGYDQDTVTADMEDICEMIGRKHPVAAYALENISYELGKSDGQPALSVAIRYTRSRAEILGIHEVEDMEAAAKSIRGAMDRCDVSLVLQVERYEEWDLLQVVENYAVENPQLVMETPQLSMEVFPESGDTRVVELFFTYQTSRDSLKTMQEQVKPVFESAVLYVSGDAGEWEKYSQLCSFLMERYDYQLTTSITPTYSLLRHGVGDSRAFAVVYSAMCRQAGLECLVVSGTKDGESHYWNIICRDGVYCHVDLLRGTFEELTDDRMEGYVWDYSAYPACTEIPEPMALEE